MHTKILIQTSRFSGIIISVSNLFIRCKLKKVFSYFETPDTKVCIMVATAEEYKDLPYYIDYVTEEDKAEVDDFLTEHYFKDEPLFESSKFIKVPEYWDNVINNIANGYSFKAVDKETGKIIGLRPNILRVRGEKATAYKNPDRQFSMFLDFVHYMLKEYDVFEKHPEINKFLQGRFVCVDRKYRNMGISKILMKITLDMLVEKEIPMYYVVCTGAFSGRLMEKMGLRDVYKIDYADYKDANGHPVFNPEPPHTTCRAFVKSLEELKADRSIK